MNIKVYSLLLVIMVLMAIIVTTTIENQQEEPQVLKHHSDNLIDHQVFFRNPYSRPIDQISLMSRHSGTVVVADIMMEPRAEPGEPGFFCTIIDKELWCELNNYGYDIVNVRCR